MKNLRKLTLLLVVALVIVSMLVMASCDVTETTGSSNESTSSSKAEGTNSSVADGTQESQKPDESVTESTGDNVTESSKDDTTDSSVTEDSTTDSSVTEDSATGSSTTDSSVPGDGNDEDDVNPNLITVTVFNQLGKPVNGAVIQICQGETCFAKPVQTGANGIGSREYTLGQGQLKAKIVSIKGMDDFLASEEYVYFEDGSREITITIQKITVNVFDDTNMAIEGAQVQLYQGEYAIDGDLITDANGVASGFVALTGGKFSAKVTKLLVNADKYDISGEAVGFDEGEYEGFLTISQKRALTVKLSDFMSGAPFAGIKVKLYLGNSFEDVATTDKNGIVRFDNVVDGNYSVEISFESPAYVSVGASEDDGRHYFVDSNVLNISVIELTNIVYTVNVSKGTAGETITVYDVNNAVFGTYETDENGTVVFEAPHGYYTAVLTTEDGKYAAPVSFVKGDSATGTIVKTDKVAGSAKDAPILLVGEMTVDFEASKAVWFAIPNANGKCVTVGAEVFFEFDGSLVERVDGYYYFTAEKGEMAVFSVTSEVNAEGVWMETKAPGTIKDPYEVSGSVKNDVAIYVGETVYYSYIADKDGTLTVTIGGDVVVLFDGNNGLNLDAGVFMYPVKAGQTVLVSLDGANLMTGIDTEVGFELGEKKLDYTISVTKDGDTADGVVVILYARNGEELVEVARATTDETGMCVFADIAYAGNYVIKAECPEGYTYIMEEVELGIEVYGSYYFTRIKTGEADAPFEFDTTEELKETAEIKENGTVWYTLYVRPNMESKFFLVANSANVVIKVYNSDTNDDGIIDGSDTPIATVNASDGKATYVFETNAMLYTIAVSTADGKAESVELEYASEELEGGATEENAIEIIESGTYTAKVNGTVYYVFAGNDSCKLTVTLTGNATLKQVIRSMDGSTLEPVDGNVLRIEDTEGTWIYFAISADEAGEYEFTVTVE